MPKSIKICPKCNSVDISLEKDNPLVWANGLPASYKCNSCGYTNKIFPEVDPSKLKKSKSIHVLRRAKDSTTEKIDISYGKFTVNIMWKIIGPLTFITGLVFIAVDINSKPIDKVKIFFSSCTLLLGLMMTYLSYKKK